MIRQKTEKKRILFVGEMVSSHAQSFVRLLDGARDEFEVLGFNVPHGGWPEVSAIPLYASWLRRVRSGRLRSWLYRAVFRFLVWRFRPHVIHSLGAFPASDWMKDLLPRDLGRTKWVLQVRGGPDVFLNRFDSKANATLREIFARCDALIADNELNYQIALELGLDPVKAFDYGIVPGTGGMDLPAFAGARQPSESLRQVVWTKAYEWSEAKGLNVLEGIKLAFPRLPGVRFVFCAVNAEVENWIRFLPKDLKAVIEIKSRLPRAQMLELMMRSRVVLAPSLLEGIPNALYEAMAARAVPIFSPLPTFRDKFANRENILYARNLYPQEVADALVEAFADDAMADRIAANNLSLVTRIANRERIAPAILALYRRL